MNINCHPDRSESIDQPHVELREVRKAFGAVCAVDRANLSVFDGERLVLLGPSGCGKTTVLRLITGLEDPDRGTILIRGHDVRGSLPRDRGLAMVFQSGSLYPHKTIRDNLRYPLRLHRWDERRIVERVHEVAALVEIEGLLGRFPHQISGGEYQRSSLAKALVSQPPLLLLDEPLSGIDAILRHRLRVQVGRILRELRLTAIIVTHDQDEAMSLGDRVALMKDGRIVQVGQPSDIYLRPATAFAAAFMGCPGMNLLPVKADAKILILDSPGTCVPICPFPSGARAACADGTAFLVGVRPEQVRLDQPLSPASGSLLRGVIQLVERLEPRSVAHVSLGVHMLSVVLDSHDVAREGENVTVSFAAEEIQLFLPSGDKERVWP